MKDYYAILGLSKTSTTEEIKITFRQLARQYHPDLNPGDKKAEALFKEINEAYEILSDRDARRKYNQTLHYQTKAPQKSSRPSSSLDEFEFDRYENFTDFIDQYFKPR